MKICVLIQVHNAASTNANIFTLFSPLFDFSAEISIPLPLKVCEIRVYIDALKLR